jgi:hypothetical protein
MKAGIQNGLTDFKGLFGFQAAQNGHQGQAVHVRMKFGKQLSHALSLT